MKRMQKNETGWCGEKVDGFGFYFPEDLILRPHGLEFGSIRMNDSSSLQFTSPLMLRAFIEENRKMEKRVQFEMVPDPNVRGGGGQKISSTNTLDVAYCITRIACCVSGAQWMWPRLVLPLCPLPSIMGTGLISTSVR